MTSAAADERQAAEQERRTSYLELFFDLVFVFAITQVTALLFADPSAAGFLRAALILGLIWWAWSGYAWMTNAIEIDRFEVRLLFLVGTAGAFFMALAVPEAFGAQGLWFAVPYLVVRMIQLVLYLTGVRNDPAQLRALMGLARMVSRRTVDRARGRLPRRRRTHGCLDALARDRRRRHADAG